MPTKTATKYRLTEDLVSKSRLLALAGDETRIRILCFMFKNSEGCVGDIANSLNMSIAAISHHLRLMKDNGLVTTERMGVNICYALVKNDFTNKLKSIICN